MTAVHMLVVDTYSCGLSASCGAPVREWSVLSLNVTCPLCLLALRSARALVPRPEVVFADEPTGNLDSRSGTEVLKVRGRSVREFGQTIGLVTHDPNAASYADRVIFLADGRIVDEMRDPTAEAVLDRIVSDPRERQTAWDTPA